MNDLDTKHAHERAQAHETARVWLAVPSRRMHLSTEPMRDGVAQVSVDDIPFADDDCNPICIPRDEADLYDAAPDLAREVVALTADMATWRRAAELLAMHHDGVPSEVAALDAAFGIVTPGGMERVMLRWGWYHRHEMGVKHSSGEVLIRVYDHATARNPVGHVEVPMTRDWRRGIDYPSGVQTWAKTVAARHGDRLPIDVLAAAIAESAFLTGEPPADTIACALGDNAFLRDEVTRLVAVNADIHRTMARDLATWTAAAAREHDVAGRLRRAARALSNVDPATLASVGPEALRAMLTARGWSKTQEIPWHVDLSETAFEWWTHHTLPEPPPRGAVRDVVRVPCRLPGVTWDGAYVADCVNAAARHHQDAPEELLAEALAIVDATPPAAEPPAS